MTIETTIHQRPPLFNGGADSVLAGLWRKILRDLSIDETTLLDKVDKYSKELTASTPEKAAQVRGNLRTDINKEDMTWFTFLKCLRLLGAEKLRFDLKLSHTQGKSDHSLSVSLKELSEDTEKESDVKKQNDLSIFFKGILNKLNVGVTLFETLLEQYMRREKVTINVRNTTHIRGYLKKDFFAPKMSWKSFIKGMMFLAVVKMEITATLEFKKAKMTEHIYSVLLGEIDDYESDGAPNPG